MDTLTNKHGHILKYLDKVEQISEEENIEGANVILLYEGKLLLCWNNYRSNWELPGGGKEKGESISQCLTREVYEETSQIIENPKLYCLYKVFIPRVNREITGVTFYTELKQLKRFLVNEEINKIILWDMESKIGEIDEIDMRIVEFVMENIKGE